MAQVLDVAFSDFQCQKNNTLHRTIEISDRRLVVRRGQPFLTVLHFKTRGFEEGTDKILCIAETGPWPDQPSGTQVIFPTTATLNRRAWSAAIEHNDSNTMSLIILPSPYAIIGQYTLKAQFSRGSKVTTYQLGTFVLIFNPWCPEDDVFLENEAQRQEYIMNDYGFFYQGNRNFISPSPWNFGQFEEDILDISLKILDKNLNYLNDAFKDLSFRHSPVYISRVVSAMVNANDDNGVVQGIWSENYEDGTCPSSWIGSVAILRRWLKSDFHPVQYGQCWVFAAVMCTVMRCLGIPARIVTNFDSAHDTNSNLIIDEYFDPTGKTLPQESYDAIWNFHVWCECWMERRDLPPGYGGWQVLDPTPQETSDGIYCCGPTSVKAIKEGEVDLNYDGPFVFSMVNADCVSWTLQGSKKEKLFCDPRLIGNHISTKGIGADEREDITENYKYDEGSPEERKVYQKALARLKKRNVMMLSNGGMHVTNGFVANGVSHEKEHPSQNGTLSRYDHRNPSLKDAKLVLRFHLSESPQLGKTINLFLVAGNLRTVPKTLKLCFSAQSMKHTGKPGQQFWKDTKYFDLEPTEEKWILLQIPYSKYGKHLNVNNLIRVTAVGEQNVTWEKVLVEKDISLTTSQVLINFLGSAALNKPCKVHLTFTNPLEEDIKDCVLAIEGSGLLKTQLKLLVGPMKSKEKSILEFEVVPYKAGLKQLQVNFASNRFRALKGYKTVIVNP